MSEMISLFIDDEMDIEEKIAFVETVHTDKSFTDEALDLLHQEKLIRGTVVDRYPSVDVKTPFSWNRFMKHFLFPAGAVASVFVATAVFFFFSMPQPGKDSLANRFVIYRPDVSRVEITGTFTDWNRIPMRKIADSGYWEIVLDLSEGEHRFTYILEGRRSFADPTIPARETDDFGGQNSVLYVEHRA